LNARALCLVLVACAGCNALFGIEDPIHAVSEGGAAGMDLASAGKQTAFDSAGAGADAAGSGQGGSSGNNAGSAGKPNGGGGALPIGGAVDHPESAGDGGEAGGADVTKTRPSCVGLARNCGVSENDDCCASPTVDGGTVFRGTTLAYPGTVKSFTLDKYEVTVARFNKFALEFTGPPAGNAGAHPSIPGSGWQTTWNSALAATSATLAANVQCHPTYQTWRGTKEERAQSRLPINCVSWYEAFAFCAWDNARLPTDVEFEYSASGGKERTYPWGEEMLSSDYAVYNCTGDKEIGCLFADITPVGSRPLGAGRWGQLDLTGSMEEWVLDSQGEYVTPCVNNCANIKPGPRLVRGGMWEYPSPPALQAATTNNSALPELRDQYGGFRCATSL